MDRFILLNPGDLDVDDALAAVDAMPGVELIDRTGGRALLVEASPATIERLRGQLSGWRISAEAGYGKPLPPHPRKGWQRP